MNLLLIKAFDAGVSNLLASLCHIGKKNCLGQHNNIPTMITDEEKEGRSIIVMITNHRGKKSSHNSLIYKVLN